METLPIDYIKRTRIMKDIQSGLRINKMQPSIISVTLLVFFAGLVHAGFPQDLDECVTKFSVPPADVQNLKNHDTPTSKEGKCAMACVMKKMNLMTSDGKFSADGMKSMASKMPGLTPDQIASFNKVADECNSEVPSMDDECECAVKIAECLRQKEKAMGLKKPELS